MSEDHRRAFIRISRELARHDWTPVTTDPPDGDILYLFNDGSVGERHGAGALFWRAAESQWQPIDTAPTDGSGILLRNHKTTAVCHRRCERWLVNWDFSTFYEPTHWAPIPK